MTTTGEKLLWGGVGIVVGVVGANWYDNRSEEQPTATDVAVESTLVPSTTLAASETTLPPTTTLPDVYTFPSGAVCRGPLVNITVEFVEEFGTYSLFKSIQAQYDPGEKFSAQPAPVAQADARAIATLSGFDVAAIPNVDNWLINGQAPTAATPAQVPTNCYLNGVQILR
jgi:hypothetical protein